MARSAASQNAKIARPNMRVLYTSGYARDAIFHNDRLDEDADLLPKPFSYDELSVKIRLSIGKL